MKKPGNFFVLVVMAGVAAASGRAVFAESVEQDQNYESSKRYEAEGNADARSYPDQRRGHPVREEYGYGMDATFHWKVTDAVYDNKGRLSMLQHVVPLHDMAAFGSVTSGIIANGLNLDRVDAVFNESDVDMQEPHYHFTQRFQTLS